MRKRKGLTVEELFNACKQMIKNGKGNAHILISTDDEGNDFHELWYLLTETKGFEKPDCIYDISDEEFENEYVMLG